MEGGRWDVDDPPGMVQWLGLLGPWVAGVRGLLGSVGSRSRAGVGWVLQSSCGCCQPVSNN